jgi:hypothetical protein
LGSKCRSLVVQKWTRFIVWKREWNTQELGSKAARRSRLSWVAIAEERGDLGVKLGTLVLCISVNTWKESRLKIFFFLYFVQIKPLLSLHTIRIVDRTRNRTGWGSLKTRNLLINIRTILLTDLGRKECCVAVVAQSSYRLDDCGSIPGKDNGLFFQPLRPDRLWGPPSLLYNGYRGLFPRGWSAAGTWCWPLTPFWWRGQERVETVPQLPPSSPMPWNGPFKAQG